MRDSFIFYRSFYEAISDLDDMQQLEIYKAVANFSLNFTEPNLLGVTATIFKLIKPQLEANNKRYENGSKPKNKQNRSEPEANPKQEISEPEANPKQEISEPEANKNKNENKNKNKKDFSYSEDFEILYDYYKKNTDRPVGDKKKAYESFKKILKEIEYKKIKLSVYNYLIECKKTQTFTKHLVSFLNSDISIYIREVDKNIGSSSKNQTDSRDILI